MRTRCLALQYKYPELNDLLFDLQRLYDSDRYCTINFNRTAINHIMADGIGAYAERTQTGLVIQDENRFLVYEAVYDSFDLEMKEITPFDTAAEAVKHYKEILCIEGL